MISDYSFTRYGLLHPHNLSIVYIKTLLSPTFLSTVPVPPFIDFTLCYLQDTKRVSNNFCSAVVIMLT